MGASGCIEKLPLLAASRMADGGHLLPISIAEMRSSHDTLTQGQNPAIHRRRERRGDISGYVSRIGPRWCAC